MGEEMITIVNVYNYELSPGYLMAKVMQKIEDSLSDKERQERVRRALKAIKDA
jgi:hypothetical protein